MKLAMVITFACMLQLNTASATTINVKSPPYNALGDTSHDDWQNILNAVADIQNGHGDTLYFPPGVYIISGPIYIRDKSSFVISGYTAGYSDPIIRVQNGRPYLRYDDSTGGSWPNLKYTYRPAWADSYHKDSVQDSLNCNNRHLS